MSASQAIKGILQIFWKHVKEDWERMDHKLLRLAAGAVGFALFALFWYYFFSASSPFKFFH